MYIHYKYYKSTVIFSFKGKQKYQYCCSIFKDALAPYWLLCNSAALICIFFFFQNSTAVINELLFYFPLNAIESFIEQHQTVNENDIKWRVFFSILQMLTIFKERLFFIVYGVGGHGVTNSRWSQGRVADVTLFIWICVVVSVISINVLQ